MAKKERKMLFEEYCRTLAGGDLTPLFEIGEMYFREGLDSSCLTLNAEELLEKMKAQALDIGTEEYLRLIAKIYFDGLRGVRKNESEVLNWSIRADRRLMEDRGVI